MVHVSFCFAFLPQLLGAWSRGQPGSHIRYGPKCGHNTLVAIRQFEQADVAQERLKLERVTQTLISKSPV